MGEWINKVEYMCISSVQFSRSVMSDSLRPYESQHPRPPGPSQSSLKLTSIESVMPSSHLILCRPLLLLPSVFPSIRVFSSELVLRIRWPKYWSFSFSISHSNKYSGLISFRIDWFHLLAVQGTLKASKQAITQSCPTLCDPMDCSIPGFLVHHQLPELAQTHIH